MTYVMLPRKSTAATCLARTEEARYDMRILVTGAAGFIGFHSARRLLGAGHQIVGIDNLNGYYDPRLKNARLGILQREPNFTFQRLDLADREGMAQLFDREELDAVLHLGAQAGVRYSIENPFAYVDSNITGTLTVLEGCRRHDIKHLIYASSSSVYGANTKQPFSVEDRVDSPISLYAATKKSDELMCQTYAHLFDIPCTGLRFFTVYGPWGRPDMAYFKFAKAILANEAIDVYNNGNMRRDFTYIDDIVDAIEAIVTRPFTRDELAPHHVYNLGNSRPEALEDLIRALESSLGRPAIRRNLPMQPGDVHATFADITPASHDYGFRPRTTLKEGIAEFVGWYKDFYGVS